MYSNLTDKEIAKMDIGEFREVIDKFNEELMGLFSIRSKMPGNLPLYQPHLDVRLRSLGVNDIDAALFLHPIYARICNRKRDYQELERIASADFSIQETLKQRTGMGKPVAIWKFYNTDSEKIVYPEREEEILARVSGLAREYSLHVMTMKRVFSDIIMKHTKGLEHCVIEQLRSKNPSKSLQYKKIKTCRTSWW